MASHRSFGRRLNNVYRWMYYGPLRCARAFRVQKHLALPLYEQFCAHVSNQNRLIFYPVPKAGTSTIRYMFRELENVKKLQWVLPAELKTPEYDGYFRFTFVRNPWSRLVSCYLDKVFLERPGRFYRLAEKYPHVRFERMSFADFVRFVCRVPRNLCDRHFRPQADFFTAQEVDFVGKFERFSDDLRYVIERSGMDRKFLAQCDTKTNRSFSLIGGGHYTDYYDDKLRRLVAEKYQDDVERFGYRFGD